MTKFIPSAEHKRRLKKLRDHLRKTLIRPEETSKKK